MQTKSMTKEGKKLQLNQVSVVRPMYYIILYAYLPSFFASLRVFSHACQVFDEMLERAFIHIIEWLTYVER